MKDTFISFDRFLTAIHRQEPDRVPHGEIAVDAEIKEAFLGRPLRSIQDEIDFAAAAGYDFLLIDTDLWSTPQVQQSILDPHPNTATLYSAAKPERNWVSTGARAITSWEEVERFTWPTADQFDYSIYPAAAALLPPGMKVISTFGHIYTTTWQLMGYENFCLTALEEPELVQNIMDRLGHETIRLLERVLEFDCVGAVCISDDIAYTNGLMISPQHLRRFFFPWLERSAETAHDHGVPIIYHTDGDVRRVVPDIITAGIDALHPIEPKCMDIVEMKQTYGDRLALIGNVDLAYTLTRGTPQEVQAEVKYLFEHVAPGGGYLLSSANSVTNYVPLENYQAMLNAAQKYGRYPITG